MNGEQYTVRDDKTEKETIYLIGDPMENDHRTKRPNVDGLIDEHNLLLLSGLVECLTNDIHAYSFS